MKVLRKNKKKKGFTLIELIAVVAIIGILAAILVPKIGGYIKEAKKTAVIDQARKVAMAIDSYEMKSEEEVTRSSSLNTVFTSTKYKSILDLAADTTSSSDAFSTGKLDKLDPNMTIQDCKDIVENRRDFNVDKDGKWLGNNTTS